MTHYLTFDKSLKIFISVILNGKILKLKAQIVSKLFFRELLYMQEEQQFSIK